MALIHEIKSAINQFSIEHNIDITNDELNNFMEKIIKKRDIIQNLCVDTFLYIGEFLMLSDIINFVTSCKKIMEFYPDLWIYLHKMYYPFSLIPTNDYLYIRNQMMLRQWYSMIYDNSSDMEYFYIIEENEKFINKRNIDLENCINKKTKMIHLKEIKVYKNENEIYLDKLEEEQKYVIDIFKYYNINDIDKKFICWKGEIDMRLYGLNPNDPDDIKKWNLEGNKWIRYKYNTFKRYYEKYVDEFSGDPDSDKFKYHYSNGEDIIYKYRTKKYPTWLAG
jgi:hypothetical protein